MIRTRRHLVGTWPTLGGTAAKPRQQIDLSRPSTSKRRFHRLVTRAPALVPPPLVLALTTTGGLPYKPRDFGRGDPRFIPGGRKAGAKPLTPRESPSPSSASGEQPVKRTYQPSNLVRKRRHGFRARMATTRARHAVPARAARGPQGPRLATRPAPPRAAPPGSGSPTPPFPWRPRPPPRAHPPLSCCRRAGETTAVRSASASPCRGRLEPPSSAIG